MGGLVLILLVVVVIAIRQEPRDTEMSNVAPSRSPSWSGDCSGYTCAGPLPQHDSIDGKRSGRLTMPTGHCTKPSARRRGGEKPLQAYTVEQVAKMLHVGRDKVYYLLRTGQLRSLKIGKLRRITEQQLAEFIASLDDARAS